MILALGREVRGRAEVKFARGTLEGLAILGESYKRPPRGDED